MNGFQIPFFQRGGISPNHAISGRDSWREKRVRTRGMFLVSKPRFITSSFCETLKTMVRAFGVVIQDFIFNRYKKAQGATMEKNKQELEALVKKMMVDSEANCREDKIYQQDMKDIGTLKIQWNFCGIQGYQIFEIENISYKLGVLPEEPDITIESEDVELSIRLLKEELFEFEYGMNNIGDFEINHTVGWKTEKSEGGERNVRINEPFLIAKFNPGKVFHPFVLSKLPVLRNLVTQRVGEGDFGAYIPINQSLGTVQNEIIPYKIFKHFIDKASNIVMLKDCPCRVFNNCQDHDKSIGCMHMGDDTLKMPFHEDKHKIVTKEEALDLVKRGIDDGLIPVLGSLMDEAQGFGIKDTRHFMSMCFCCTCCCVNGHIITHASQSLNPFTRMEGITVKVDEDLCTGCEDCLEVCVFKGLEMVDGFANVVQTQCLGCGRCTSACPTEAISIDIDDPSRVDEIIKKLESHVDVT
ncbi:MAG: 4Fe-4S dicluster domain-containing protein [Proteobacteria bacterium]|nr:4Fe-4S dicluster domain-containing protein [Pseudomonadota bacterium]